MRPDKPDVRESSLYTQAQTARALRINRHTVKRYEETGLLRFRLRKADNRKVTTGKQIIKVWENCY